MVDSYTTWFVILKCRRPTITVAKSFLHETFSRFGIHYSIVSDNGRQFTSREFKFFCKSLQIRGAFNKFPDTFVQALS